MKIRKNQVKNLGKGNIIAGTSGDNTVLSVGSNGQVLSADSSETCGLKWVDAPSGGGTVVNSTADGRLTLTTATPVTTSDVSSASTVYYTPYVGNSIALYDTIAEEWYYLNFSEISIVLDSLTSGKNYDIFAYDNSDVLALVLSSAWTNDTTRADAISMQDGVWVLTSDKNKRYVGTFRTTSTTTTQDSVTKRFLFNANNRVQKTVYKHDNTDYWDTASNWRSANNSVANRIEIVNGIDSFIELEVMCRFMDTGNTEKDCVGIGEDKTNGTNAEIYNNHNYFSYDKNNTLLAELKKFPSIGYHYYQWVEFTYSGTTSRWYGDDGGYCKSGIYGTFFC